MNPQKGFFASLFDLSFQSLITPRIIKVLYVLTLFVIGVVSVFFVIAAFAKSALAGAVTLLILVPIGALFYVIYARVALELFIAIFRIMESGQSLVAIARERGDITQA
jgi:hypothetical protein